MEFLDDFFNGVEINQLNLKPFRNLNNLNEIPLRKCFKNIFQ